MRTLRFSQGFALSRERLTRMLLCIAEGRATSESEIGSYMGVNKPVVEAFRGWLCKTGLGRFEKKCYSLTPLGEIVVAHDPNLQLLGTLWLLHYHLVSEHDERAEVWYHCFNGFLRPGQSFSSADLQMFVNQQIEETPSNRDGIARDIGTLTTSYVQLAYLGNLRLLVESGRGMYIVGDIAIPDPLIVAYVLFDSWHRRFGASDSVRLSTLVDEPESIGRVFVADNPQVRLYIEQLQRLGLVTFADTQHEPVTRRFFDDPLTVIKRYYQQP